MQFRYSPSRGSRKLSCPLYRQFPDSKLGYRYTKRMRLYAYRLFLIDIYKSYNIWCNVASHFTRNRVYYNRITSNKLHTRTYHILRECQYDSLELGTLECKTSGNDPVDFVANIHNTQREFEPRVSGMRTNYWLSYHFPINPKTSSDYARAK
jgi:hypothetical protein